LAAQPPQTNVGHVGAKMTAIQGHNQDQPQAGSLGTEVEQPSRESRGSSGGRRANKLDGKTWTRYSISIWSDIRKTKDEIDLHHPAIFPSALVTRLIQCFTNDEDRNILDPFVGIGSTAIAAEAMGKIGIGFELNPDYAAKARMRPLVRDSMVLLDDDAASGGARVIHNVDAARLLDYVEPNSIDMVITSPPYWDILLQYRTADYKETRHYGDAADDLGKIRDYDAFLDAISSVFCSVYAAMRRGKYCAVVAMDIRKKNRFYPYHSDIATFMQRIGFIYDDIIIWDRRHEYNNMRPLGYPAKFRINKAHEYIVLFQKP
jgi:DNA modification methylase